MIIDIWNEENRDRVDRMDCFFNDLSCKYSGNLFAGSKPVGDYTARNSEEVERVAKMFKIDFSWR